MSYTFIRGCIPKERLLELKALMCNPHRTHNDASVSRGYVEEKIDHILQAPDEPLVLDPPNRAYLQQLLDGVRGG